MSAGPILITGSASGIGLGLAERLQASGVHVIGWDQQSGGASEVVIVDVTDENSVGRAAEQLPPTLAAVVTCAGVSSRLSLVDSSLEEFRRVVDINLVGTLAVARATHSRLRGGTLVTIGSVAATVPMAARGAYCASKAAVVMLTKVLGSEWAADDIAVLCVSPGFVNTGMATRGASEGVTDLSRVLDRSPTGSLVDSEDLVRVLMLASTGALAGMTGTEIVVDGGYIAGSRI